MKRTCNTIDDAAEKRRRAPRDPEGRKQAIVEAAADIISTGGTKKVTNRSVAEHAGVPLGSTTQYFKNIDDLRTAGLKKVAERFRNEYDDVFTITKKGVEDENVLVDCILAYLANTELIQIDAALRTAAMEEPEVRDIVNGAFATFLTDCEKIMSRQRALILFAFIEGTMINSIYAGIPYERETIERAIHLILKE